MGRAETGNICKHVMVYHVLAYPSPTLPEALIKAATADPTISKGRLPLPFRTGSSMCVLSPTHRAHDYARTMKNLNHKLNQPTAMLGKTFTRGYATPIRSTLLLSRTPVITADLPDFQKLYYKYQKELWKRLMWTFPKWFYFREGTLAEQKYRELNKNPVYNNPNLEFVGGRPDIKHQRDRRFKQEVHLPKTYDTTADASMVDSLSRKIVPNSRTTEADKVKDLASLERKLARTLYLVVSEDGKTWKFPSFAGEGPLHKVAEEGLYAMGGDKINYFCVSNKPCHVTTTGEGKDFVIKLHILSGEFAAQNPDVKFMWLTKEEVGEYLDSEYYGEIGHLMSEV